MLYKNKGKITLTRQIREGFLEVGALASLSRLSTVPLSTGRLLCLLIWVRPLYRASTSPWGFFPHTPTCLGV